MTAAFNSVAPVFSSLVHNPLGAIGLGSVGVGLFNGFDMEKMKQNVAVAALAVMGAWYAFPAFFAAAKTASVAVSTQVASASQVVSGYAVGAGKTVSTYAAGAGKAVTTYTAGAYKAVAGGAQKYLAKGPLADLLNKITFFESGNNLAAIEGGGNLIDTVNVGDISDVKGSLGRMQGIGTTRNNLINTLNISDAANFVNPQIQIPMEVELLKQQGLMNPAVPAETVADNLAKQFCVIGEQGTTPTARCIQYGANPVAPISRTQILKDIFNFRKVLPTLNPAMPLAW